MSRGPRLRAGEWIRVKSKQAILATLDKDGRLDGLPFMPEMFRHCGQQFTVGKRAHKTCDPPNGLQARRMLDAVHLEDVRCDGQAHGGCQAGCLVFWKEAWLEKAGDASDCRPTDVMSQAEASTQPRGQTIGCSEHDVWAGARMAPHDQGPQAEPIFICQSTHLAGATLPLAWWDVRQYIEDYTSGNVGLRQILASFFYWIYSGVAEAGLGLGSFMRWTYDRFQGLRGGTPYPSRMGKIPIGAPTPAARLDLRPGEFVKIKSYGEILATLNENWHNRGMYFDSEEVPFCGGTFEVLCRVEKIIDERNGRMMNLKNDAIILKDVWCQSRYARCRKFCPRGIYAYWREIWLERVEQPAQTPRN
jgi:hypothetical protein